MAKEINENEADIADIQAGLEKRQSLYFFIGAALFMFLIGFSFKTCMVYEASRPPDPPVLIPSVECVRAGGNGPLINLKELVNMIEKLKLTVIKV